MSYSIRELRKSKKSASKEFIIVLIIIKQSCALSICKHKGNQWLFSKDNLERFESENVATYCVRKTLNRSLEPNRTAEWSMYHAVQLVWVFYMSTVSRLMWNMRSQYGFYLLRCTALVDKLEHELYPIVDVNSSMFLGRLMNLLMCVCVLSLLIIKRPKRMWWLQLNKNKCVFEM